MWREICAETLSVNIGDAQSADGDNLSALPTKALKGDNLSALPTKPPKGDNLSALPTKPPKGDNLSVYRQNLPKVTIFPFTHKSPQR